MFSIVINILILAVLIGLGMKILLINLGLPFWAYYVALPIVGAVLYLINSILIKSYIAKETPEFASTEEVLPDIQAWEVTAGTGVVPKWVSWIGIISISCFVALIVPVVLYLGSDHIPPSVFKPNASGWVELEQGPAEANFLINNGEIVFSKGTNVYLEYDADTAHEYDLEESYLQVWIRMKDDDSKNEFQSFFIIDCEQFIIKKLDHRIFKDGIETLVFGKKFTNWSKVAIGDIYFSLADEMCFHYNE